MSKYSDELPKEVVKNFKQRGGEYCTLHFIVDDVMDELVLKYLPYIGTRYMEKLPKIMRIDAARMAVNYGIEDDLAYNAVSVVLSYIVALQQILENTNFEKWYDEQCGYINNHTENCKKNFVRDQIFHRRPLHLKPGSTDEDLAKAIKEDLKNRGYTSKEAEKLIMDGHIGGSLDGRFVDIKKYCSYNKGRKKDENITRL